MTAEQKHAVQAIKEFYPKLEEFVNFLKALKEKFSSIAYYEKFKFITDNTSSLPLEHVTEFCIKARDMRISLFSFKQSFNENDLPDVMREMFIVINVAIVQKKLTMKDGVACIGGLGVKKKLVTEVLFRWDDIKYPNQLIYSQEAFNVINGYFPLIKTIEALKHSLKEAVS